MSEELDAKAREYGAGYVRLYFPERDPEQSAEAKAASSGFRAGYLAAQQEAWRPIEEYEHEPGAHVIVAAPNYVGDGLLVGEAYYREDEDQWWWANQAPGDFDPSGAIVPEPTHWRPLPAPPSHGGDDR